MSLSLLCLITHLFVATYSLFLWWKHDLLSKGKSIDTLADKVSDMMNKQTLVSLINGFCLAPGLNLITLYLIIADDLEAIYDTYKAKQINA